MVLATAPMWYFALSVAMFSIGIFGILTLKSGIRVLMAIELMLNAANVNFAAFGKMWAANSPLPVAPQTGVSFALFSIAIAAAEAAVGLAIFVSLFRLKNGIDVDKADLLRW